MTGGHPGVIVTLRRARSSDAGMLRAWRNDAASVQFSATARPVSVAEHRAWLAAVLEDPGTRLWIAEEGSVAVGQVRVETDGPTGVVSIAVAPHHRGRGVARGMLTAAMAEVRRDGGTVTLVARVHPDNVASLRAFESVGFHGQGSDGAGFLVLERTVGSG